MAPAQTVAGGQGVGQTFARIGREFKQTFLHWDAIPYTMLVTAPFCSGAMIGLLPSLAADYGVTGEQVAWINGLGGALLTAAGAFLASLIPIRVRAPIAFILAGLLNAATMAVLAIGPQRPTSIWQARCCFCSRLERATRCLQAWCWSFWATQARAAARVTRSSTRWAICPLRTWLISMGVRTRIGDRAPCPQPMRC